MEASGTTPATAQAASYTQTLSYDDAYAATDPNASEDQRDQAARLILLGARANQVYWDSRSDVERLVAIAQGHGLVTRGEDIPHSAVAPSDTRAGLGTPTDNAGTVEGTATDEPADAQVVPPNPDNPTEAVAQLRAQLERAGIRPEA